MPLLVLSLTLLAASKLELSEDPIEVRVPKGVEAGDVADALAVIQEPASQAALYEAVKRCVLLGVDVSKVIAAAKAGAAATLDERLLAVADGYLGFGDWAHAEKALKATRPSAGVHERLGHALRGQKRFPEAAKAYVAAVEGGAGGAELDEILRRVVPVTVDWVTDWEAGGAAPLRDGAKAMLTAMLPRQAGDPSETTKKLLARLGAKAPPSPRPSLTAARLKDAIAVQLPALRACYARALVEEPTLKGPLVVELAVDPPGRVSSVRTTTNGTGSKSVAKCVEQGLKALHVVTQSSVAVVYPLELRPL